MFRSIHQLSMFYAFYEVGLITNNTAGIADAVSITGQLLKAWAVQCVCGYSLNVFHMA